MVKLPQDYKINLTLDSGANLEILLFDNTEHRWIFSYEQVSPEKDIRLEKPELINDLSLCVEYERGVSKECTLTMNMIFPKRRGKKFFAGVDISELSLLNIEAIYKKQEKVYILKTIDLGSHGFIDMDAQGEGLIDTSKLPFPIKIERDYGTYSIPFLKNNGEKASFEFPDSYKR